MSRYPSIQHAVIACAPAFECPAIILDSPLPVVGLYSVICVPGQCVQPVVYFRHIKKLLYDRYNNRFLYFTQVVKAQFYDCDARE